MQIIVLIIAGVILIIILIVTLPIIVKGLKAFFGIGGAGTTPTPPGGTTPPPGPAAPTPPFFITLSHGPTAWYTGMGVTVVVTDSDPAGGVAVTSIGNQTVTLTIKPGTDGMITSSFETGSLVTTFTDTTNQFGLIQKTIFGSAVGDDGLEAKISTTPATPPVSQPYETTDQSS